MTDSAGTLWHSALRWVCGRGRRAGSADSPGALTAARADPAPAGAPLAPGSELGNYRILRLLGRGGMGALYLAVDASSQDTVALKTMALAREFNGSDYEQARQRFMQEAQAATRLQHPDIVRVFGAGEARGLAFIVMEALSGSNLGRYARPSRLLPEPVVLRIAARVAAALAYAHRQGVVHRDIKPSNVMVDLVAHQVKVTDFGVARLTDAARTRSGLVLGTPSFMSPEQLAGASLDGRSDLYSLGVMLFQLLTGRLPYEGESMGQLLQAIAGQPPLDLRALRPELPDALAVAVAHALEKSPLRRYADGQQVADDLLRIASQWDVPARSP